MATVYDEMGNVIFEDPADTAPVAEKVGYYEAKMIEFQDLLYRLDASANTMQQIIDGDFDPALTIAAEDWLTEYENQKWKFKGAAETLNFAIAGWNQVGGNLKEFSLPPSLGLAPLGLPALAAAVAAIAALTVIALRMLDNANALANSKALFDNIKDPAAKTAAAAKLLQLDAESKQNATGTLSTLAGSVKWIALAAVAFFAYQAYTKGR